jgi:hypothetical protein
MTPARLLNRPLCLVLRLWPCLARCQCLLRQCLPAHLPLHPIVLGPFQMLIQNQFPSSIQRPCLPPIQTQHRLTLPPRYPLLLPVQCRWPRRLRFRSKCLMNSPGPCRSQRLNLGRLMNLQMQLLPARPPRRSQLMILSLSRLLALGLLRHQRPSRPTRQVWLLAPLRQRRQSHLPQMPRLLAH